MSLKLTRSTPPEWFQGSPCANQMTAVLEGEDGLGVSVPVSLLVADSLLAREVLRGHEAGQERLLTLVQVEGDTLRQYSQILRTGSTVIRTGAGDRRMAEESVDKLRQLLKMLDSQIILDHEGTFGEEEEDCNDARSGLRPQSRKRLKTSLSSRQRLDFDSDRNNNDEEEEGDIPDQSAQIREEKRRSIIPPPLSPAVSFSTPNFSPIKPRTPKNKITKNTESLTRRICSTPTGMGGSKSKNDRRLTLGGQSKVMTHPLTKIVRGPKSSEARRWDRPPSDKDQVMAKQMTKRILSHLEKIDAIEENVTDSDSNAPDMAMGTARNMGSEPKQSSSLKLATVKKETPDTDDDYESLLLPGYDDKINDVIATVNSCPVCQKEFNGKGRLRAHISQAHPDPKTVQHYKCPHCSWSSTNPGSLGSHIVKIHPDKAEVYNCVHCPEKFTNKQIWHKHMPRCEANKTSVTCPRCSANFSSLGYYRRHLKKNCPGSNKASKVKNQVSNANAEDNEAVEKDIENDELLASDHGDLEDTRDDHISCKECGGKPFTQEGFKRHMMQTGHTGETIKLPSYLSV